MNFSGAPTAPPAAGDGQKTVDPKTAVFYPAGQGECGSCAFMQDDGSCSKIGITVESEDHCALYQNSGGEPDDDEMGGPSDADADNSSNSGSLNTGR